MGLSSDREVVRGDGSCKWKREGWMGECRRRYELVLWDGGSRAAKPGARSRWMGRAQHEMRDWLAGWTERDERASEGDLGAGWDRMGRMGRMGQDGTDGDGLQAKCQRQPRPDQDQDQDQNETETDGLTARGGGWSGGGSQSLRRSVSHSVDCQAVCRLWPDWARVLLVWSAQQPLDRAGPGLRLGSCLSASQ